ncbi:MAG: hypothetical protein DRO15_02095, partial [Thermoprotei archaeon]
FEYIKDISSEYELGKKVTKYTSRLLNILYSIDEVVRNHEPQVSLTMIQEPIYCTLLKLVNPKLGTGIYIHYPFEEELSKENIEIFLNLYRFPGRYEDMFRYVDLHLTNSNYTASALFKRFKIESNVVYPAVPWRYFKEELDVEEERENIIISVGRFVPLKRHDVLINWFKNYIKPRVNDAELVIIGLPDVRFKNYYEKLMKMSSEVSGVTIIDKPLKPEEMIRYYRRAKIYVHLRIGEHFGMAPVEAMSQGAIPILPERSGLTELITHGKSGFAFHSDEEAINYIIKVLTMPRSNLIEIRRNAYRKSWYFNPDRFAKEVLNYLKILV